MKDVDLKDLSPLDSPEDIVKKIVIHLNDPKLTFGGVRLISRSSLKYDTVYDHLDPGAILSNLNQYDNVHTSSFKELLKSLKEKFPKLTSQELLYSIEYFVSELIPGISKPDNEFIERMKKDITNTLQTTKINVENWFGVKRGKLDYVISSINGYIKVASKPLDLYKIIKEVPVNANCPLMFMISEETGEPIIKYSTAVKKELIKEWTIKETGGAAGGGIGAKGVGDLGAKGTKKVPGKAALFKSPKGLFMKIFYKKGIYISASVSKIFPKINLKSKIDPDDHYTFENIHNYFTFFNPIVNAIKKSFKSQNVSAKETSITSVSFQIKVKKPIDLKKLYSVSDKSTVDRANKEYVKYKFKNGVQLDVRISTDGYLVTGHYIKSEKQINETITNLVKLLDKTEGGENKIPTKKQGKGNKDFKKLKDIGVAVDVVSCQKFRRPQIYTEGSTVKTHTLDVNNSKLFCPKEPYIYPGFTNVNVPCCFKRDQRSKQVYKRNVGIGITTKQIPDRQILKSILITTDKILDYGRIGVLDHVLKRLLGDKFLRLGVVQDQNSFQNCIFELTGKKVDYFISKLTEKIYNTLSDGDLAASSSFSSFVKSTSKSGIDSSLLKLNVSNVPTVYADLVSKVLETNVIMINLEGNQHYFTCENKTSYTKSILVFNRGNGIYEPIVRRVNASTLQRVFTKEIDNVINLKNKLCTKLVYPYNVLSISKLAKQGVKIHKQIVSDFNKVEFVKTDYGILPVAITGPKIGIPTIKKFELITASTQLKFLNEISKKKELSILEPYSQIVNSKGKCVGIVTLSNIIVPVLQSPPLPKLNKIVTDLPVGGISNTIYNGTVDPMQDPRAKNAYQVNYYVELYERFRFTLSSILLVNPGLKQEIMRLRDNGAKRLILESVIDSILKKVTILTSTDVPVEIPTVRYLCHAISEGCNDVDPFCGKKSESGKCLLKISKKLYPNFIKKLSVEVINDNAILNGEIRSNFLGRNNFINYKNQKIVFTENDIKRFIA